MNTKEALEKLELPYNPESLFLNTDPQELKAGTLTDICVPMFTAVLFTVAKRWQQIHG